jgi:SAM-dependent methyltransferase
MEPKSHWEAIYSSKSPENVSWFTPHLAVSLDLIRQAAPDRNVQILDVGGGASTLVDDLVEDGYMGVTVLDISATALKASQKRLGNRADTASWIEGDILDVTLKRAFYDVWHDRAVFHFLATSEERSCYVSQASQALKRGGHLIIATFASDGPEKCSGLNVVRYEPDQLSAVFGSRFHLAETHRTLHSTPAGKQQSFVYCRFEHIGLLSKLTA